jgi:hypothetical protein
MSVSDHNLVGRDSAADTSHTDEASESWALGLLAMLWCAALFIFFTVAPFASPGLLWVMGVGGAVVLAYCTAAILGMTKQFTEHHRPDVRPAMRPDVPFST